MTEPRLCYCGCLTPALPGKVYAQGHFNKNQRARQKTEKEFNYANNSKGLTFHCKVHPDFVTTDRAEARRHFATEDHKVKVKRRSLYSDGYYDRMDRPASHARIPG